jgi:hypothetical protein
VGVAHHLVVIAPVDGGFPSARAAGTTQPLLLVAAKAELASDGTERDHAQRAVDNATQLHGLPLSLSSSSSSSSVLNTVVAWVSVVTWDSTPEISGIDWQNVAPAGAANVYRQVRFSHVAIVALVPHCVSSTTLSNRYAIVAVPCACQLSSCTRASNTLPHCHACARLKEGFCGANRHESMCCLITFTFGIQQMCSHSLALRRDLCGLSAGRARTACNQLRAHPLPRIDSTTQYFACGVTGCFTWSTLKMEEGGARVTVRVSHINACNH